MPPPVVEAYPVSNLTQTQSVVNLPLINPDIQGYGVRLSSFIAHLCVALLITYSTKTQRRFYFPLLSQVALTIFAVWLCRGRNQLSTSDIEFAIIQTRSPVSVYILLLVIPRLFFQKSAFKKKDATPKPDDRQSCFHGIFNSESLDWALIRHRLWGLLYASYCLSINLILRFDKAGYIHVAQAATGPLVDPTTPPSLIRLEGGPDGKVWTGLAVCSAFVYECVLHRHAEQRRDIMHQLAGKRKKSLKAWPSSKRIRWGFAATWFIATKLHPWLPFFYASVMFLNWSRDMRIWAIEDNFQWTYGQLLAISQVIIIIYPCWKLCYSRWREIVSLPHRLVFDIIWLISGKCQPWTDPAESDLILRNIWDAFPLDVTPKDIGLPTATPAPSLGVIPADDTSVHSMRSRRRLKRTNLWPRLKHVTDPLEEEDIVDQTSNRGWVDPL